MWPWVLHCRKYVFCFEFCTLCDYVSRWGLSIGRESRFNWIQRRYFLSAILRAVISHWLVLHLYVEIKYKLVFKMYFYTTSQIVDIIIDACFQARDLSLPWFASIKALFPIYPTADTSLSTASATVRTRVFFVSSIYFCFFVSVFHIMRLFSSCTDQFFTGGRSLFLRRGEMEFFYRLTAGLTATEYTAYRHGRLQKSGEPECAASGACLPACLIVFILTR